jgi:hypothetical protein
MHHIDQFGGVGSLKFAIPWNLAAGLFPPKA